MLSKKSSACLIVAALGGCVSQSGGPKIISDRTEVVVGKTVLHDRSHSLNFAYSINPDCTPRGEVEIQILERPVNGTATVSDSRDYTNFPPSNERAACNKTQRDGKRLTYKPNPGFAGADGVVVDEIFPDGNVRHVRFVITVR